MRSPGTNPAAGPTVGRFTGGDGDLARWVTETFPGTSDVLRRPTPAGTALVGRFAHAWVLAAVDGHGRPTLSPAVHCVAGEHWSSLFLQGCQTAGHLQVKMGVHEYAHGPYEPQVHRCGPCETADESAHEVAREALWRRWLHRRRR